MTKKKCFDCKTDIQGGILCENCEQIRRKEFEKRPERFGDMGVTVRPRVLNRKIIRRKRK